MFRRYDSNVLGFTCVSTVGSHWSSTHSRIVSFVGSVYVPSCRSPTIFVRAPSASLRVRKPPCHFWRRLPFASRPRSTTTYQLTVSLPAFVVWVRLRMCPCMRAASCGRRRNAEPLQQRRNGNDHAPTELPAGDLAAPGGCAPKTEQRCDFLCGEVSRVSMSSRPSGYERVRSFMSEPLMRVLARPRGCWRTAGATYCRRKRLPIGETLSTCIDSIHHGKTGRP